MNDNTAVALDNSDAATATAAVANDSTETVVTNDGGDSSGVNVDGAATAALTDGQAAAVAATATPKNKPGRPVDPNSKYSRAALLYAELAAKGDARKVIIAEFVSQLGVSPGSAAVYYHTIKNGGKKA